MQTHKTSQGELKTMVADTENVKKKRKQTDRIRLLLLCNYDPYNASMVCEHINSFVKYSQHDVYVLSNLGNPPAGFTFEAFDVIIIHYSLTLAIEAYIGPKLRNDLRLFKGLKALFIQDEYRFINKTIEAIDYCGISLIFTCVPNEDIPKVYSPKMLPGVTFKNVLTGYVSASLANYPTIPLEARRIMVGYRGRTYPAWHGRAGMEKIEIGARFLQDARKYKLRCDIKWREKDRLYGQDWVKLIRSCRAFLAVESGASVFDFSGTISSKTDVFTDLLEEDKVSHHPMKFLPELKDHYAKMKERYFGENEDEINLSQISPRVFEAAALRTLLIMYEGDYSGIFKAGHHFVALKKDHSNMDEVAAILRNPTKCAEIIANAYAEIVQNPAYSAQTFIVDFDKTINKYLTTEMKSAVRKFSRENYEKVYPIFLIDNPHSVESQKHLTIRRPLKLGRAAFRRLHGLVWR